MTTQQRFIQLNALRIRKINIQRMIKDTIFISIGVMAAAFGLKSFLLPNDFLDGGVVGISLLVNVLTDIDLSYLIVIINLPFILIAYTQISRIFAIKTLVGIALLAIVLAFMPF